MAYTLRVYKHGSSSYTEITNAMAGGWTDIEWTRVRNDAGALVVDLEATTPAMLHEWLDEAALVKLYDGTTCLAQFEVDSYTPRWERLTCRLQCAGLLVAGKGVPYTGTFTDTTAGTVFAQLASSVPGWGWNGTKVDIGGVVDLLDYKGDKVLEAIATLAQLCGFDYWLDGDGDLNGAEWPTEVGKTLTLNDNAFTFDTTYSAVDIVNQLILVTSTGTWTYDEETSQAAYGIRSETVTVAGIVTEAVGQAWATGVFASLAYPIQQMTVTAEHDAAHVPGLLVAVEGLEDGRTYEDVITQVGWMVGDFTDTLQIGHQPPTIQPPATVAETAAAPYDPGMGDNYGGGGGAGLYLGTVTHVGSGTVDVMVGTTEYTDVARLASYSPHEDDIVVLGDVME